GARRVLSCVGGARARRVVPAARGRGPRQRGPRPRHSDSEPATIVVPIGNNPEKNEATQAYGARLIEYGRDFDEAREEAERLSKAENLRYIHSANEPHLINGVGTYAIEIIEALQERNEKADAIFAPIVLGSGICGVVTAVRALSPETAT